MYNGKKDTRKAWRIPEDLAKAIKDIAAKDDRTILGTLRNLVKLYNEGKLS